MAFEVEVDFDIIAYLHYGREVFEVSTVQCLASECLKMKPNYEKPFAVPLGEAAKGSGQCNVGSAVLPSQQGCIEGHANCVGGWTPTVYCNSGLFAT